MNTSMASDNGKLKPTVFRPEDEIDEVFGRANPNPVRAGCPKRELLLSAGRKALPIDHPVYEHLAGCSACYHEFRQFQQSVGVPLRLHPALPAAAAILLAVAAVTYFAWRGGIESRSEFQENAAARRVLLDYRGESATRGEAGDPVRKPITLSNSNLDTTILLPVGSEPGLYELQLLDAAQRTRLAKQVSAQLKDFTVRIETNLDLRTLARGRYILEIRRQGEDWDPHPLVIR